MKRITAILLLAVMAFALCSCGPEDNKDDGKPSAEAKQLWALLDGAWVRDDGNNSFLTFSSEGDILFVSYGLLATEFAAAGNATVTFLEGLKCSFDVDVAEFGGNDEVGSAPFHTESFTLDASSLSSGVISCTDHADDGAKHEFRYVGPDLNSIDVDEILYPESTAWSKMWGCWACEEGANYYFVQFCRDTETYEPIFYTGMPMSGYGLWMNLTSFKNDKDNQKYIVGLFMEGWENEESSMPDFDTEAVIDYSRLDEGILQITNVAGDGTMHTFLYACEDVYDLDWDVLDKLFG